MITNHLAEIIALLLLTISFVLPGYALCSQIPQQTNDFTVIEKILLGQVFWGGLILFIALLSPLGVPYQLFSWIALIMLSPLGLYKLVGDIKSKRMKVFPSGVGVSLPVTVISFVGFLYSAGYRFSSINIPVQTRDPFFHYEAVGWFTHHANTSPFSGFSELINQLGQHKPTFYPNLFHLFALYPAKVSNAVLATNLTILVIITFSLIPAFLVLAARILPILCKNWGRPFAVGKVFVGLGCVENNFSSRKSAKISSDVKQVSDTESTAGLGLSIIISLLGVLCVSMPSIIWHNNFFAGTWPYTLGVAFTIIFLLWLWSIYRDYSGFQLRAHTKTLKALNTKMQSFQFLKLFFLIICACISLFFGHPTAVVQVLAVAIIVVCYDGSAKFYRGREYTKLLTLWGGVLSLAILGYLITKLPFVATRLNYEAVERAPITEIKNLIWGVASYGNVMGDWDLPLWVLLIQILGLVICIFSRAGRKILLLCVSLAIITMFAVGKPNIIQYLAGIWYRDVWRFRILFDMLRAILILLPILVLLKNMKIWRCGTSCKHDGKSANNLLPSPKIQSSATVSAEKSWNMEEENRHRHKPTNNFLSYGGQVFVMILFAIGLGFSTDYYLKPHEISVHVGQDMAQIMGGEITSVLTKPEMEEMKTIENVLSPADIVLTDPAGGGSMLTAYIGVSTYPNGYWMEDNKPNLIITAQHLADPELAYKACKTIKNRKVGYLYAEIQKPTIFGMPEIREELTRSKYVRTVAKVGQAQLLKLIDCNK